MLHETPYHRALRERRQVVRRVEAAVCWFLLGVVLLVGLWFGTVEALAALAGEGF